MVRLVLPLLCLLMFLPVGRPSNASLLRGIGGLMIIDEDIVRLARARQSLREPQYCSHPRCCDLSSCSRYCGFTCGRTSGDSRSHEPAAAVGGRYGKVYLITKPTAANPSQAAIVSPPPVAQTVAPPAPTTALPPPAPFLPAVMSMGGDGMGFNPGIPGTPILPTVMEGGFGGEEIRDFPEYDDEAEVTEAAGGDVEDDFAPDCDGFRCEFPPMDPPPLDQIQEPPLPPPPPSAPDMEQIFMPPPPPPTEEGAGGASPPTDGAQELFGLFPPPGEGESERLTTSGMASAARGRQRRPMMPRRGRSRILARPTLRRPPAALLPIPSPSPSAAAAAPLPLIGFGGHSSSGAVINVGGTSTTQQSGHQIHHHRHSSHPFGSGFPTSFSMPQSQGVSPHPVHHRLLLPEDPLAHQQQAFVRCTSSTGEAC